MDKVKQSTSPIRIPKKPYRTPVLSLYGDVRQLTRGGNGTGVDAGVGPMTMVCWIAEALYGYDAPRVFLVRAWLAQCFERGDWWSIVIVPLYRRFGKRVASGIRAYPILERLFRPAFDCAVRHAFRAHSAEFVVRSNLA